MMSRGSPAGSHHQEDTVGSHAGRGRKVRTRSGRGGAKGLPIMRGHAPPAPPPIRAAAAGGSPLPGANDGPRPPTGNPTSAKRAPSELP